jgi:metallo-beta-lactamase family protein
MATIQFLGAAGTVTGSRHLLDIDNKRLLIDCGLFQGNKENRLRNWEPFPVDPGSIDNILLTHAHIDHTGFLPAIVRDGFSGPIYCTKSTFDLLKILLPDSAHLQEEDAAWANRKGFSKHKPAKPLYTVEDAKRVPPLCIPVNYNDSIEITTNTRAKYRDAGHIIGSAFVDIKTWVGNRSRKIIFSGDLGRPNRPILRDPSQAFNADYLVLESTYGNRLHPDNDPKQELADVINRSVERGGVLLIPAFAVGRTQTLLYVIRELEEEGKIPELNVFIDSPMGIDALKLFKENISDFDLESRVELIRGKQVFRPKKLRICRTSDESKSINKFVNRSIIISSSGMATGGRILHHLVQRLPDKRNTVLFIGYQAEGTRGRTMLEGAETVKIHGQHIPINAKIEQLSGYSGHADYNEILAWLLGFNKTPEKVFLVHGEPDAANSLADKIREMFGWEVIIPNIGDKFELDL